MEIFDEDGEIKAYNLGGSFCSFTGPGVEADPGTTAQPTNQANI
jgi:hypothetical protein